MATTALQCPLCAKRDADSHGRASDRNCPYCLVKLGLDSAAGSVSTASGRRSLSSFAGVSPSQDRLFRQGVLPVFDDYELESEIARGGMGVVYRARQTSLNRTVAIKLILAGQLATPESVSRFRLEAEAAARLHHPGIVQIFDVGECETQHFLSMQLIDGMSLAECLPEFCVTRGATTAERHRQEHCIADLIGRVARALHFAHQRGVLHCDLKPSNILIDDLGLPHLTDFGLAKLIGREASGLTLSNAVLGTPAYLAPEQASGRSEVTTATDVYGLGATLYELLTGRPPFSGSTAVETMWQAIEQTPLVPRQINPAINGDIQTIVMRCLEKSPPRRYASAAAVADELERFVGGVPIQARPAGRGERAWRWCRRNPYVASLSAALLIAMIVGLTASLWQWRRAEVANVTLTRNVGHLEWDAISGLIDSDQASSALARVALLLRKDPTDRNAAMFAMSVLERQRFAVPAAPPIRHPGGAELAVARLSPDGRTIATASTDGTARLWDAATSKEVAVLRHDKGVTWADFSPDGKTLATASEDGTARLWSVPDGRTVAAPRRHAEPVTRVQFSPDGHALLIRTATGFSIVEVASGNAVIGPLRVDGRIVCAEWHGDVCMIASRADNGSAVEMWDTRSRSRIETMRTDKLMSAAVSPDRRRIAAVTADGRAWVADFPSGARRRDIPGQAGSFLEALFSPDGTRIATVGQSYYARVWDSETVLPITAELPHYYIFGGAAFIDGGKRLLTWAGDSTARVWDTATGRPASEPLRHADQVKYAEAKTIDGRATVLTATSHARIMLPETGTGAAQLWILTPGRSPLDRFFGADQGFDGSALSADGKLVAVAKSRGPVHVYDAATGRHVAGPLATRGGCWGVLFTSDNSRIITTTSIGEVSVWLLATGQRVAPPLNYATMTQPAELSPDGRLFATGSTDGRVRLFDSSTSQLVREMRHGGEINALEFSPDGRLMACAGADRTVKLWEVSTGRPAGELTGHKNEVLTARFSPDGKRMVTASLDFTSRVWDLATGRQLHMLSHQGDVLDAAFSPDGRYVATASRDRTAVVWDADTGLPHARPMNHEQGVRNLRFLPDGHRLITVDFRGLRLWDIDTGHPLTVHMTHRMFGGTGFQSTSTNVALTPDGDGALLGCDSYECTLWHFSTPPAGAPVWFAELLEAVANRRVVEGTDQPEYVPPEAFVALRQRLQASTDTDAYTRWARQWLGFSGYSETLAANAAQ